MSGKSVCSGNSLKKVCWSVTFLGWKIKIKFANFFNLIDTVVSHVKVCVSVSVCDFVCVARNTHFCNIWWNVTCPSDSVSTFGEKNILHQKDNFKLQKWEIINCFSCRKMGQNINFLRPVALLSWISCVLLIMTVQIWEQLYH